MRDEQQALMWGAQHLDGRGAVSGVALAAGEHRKDYVLEVHRPLVPLRGRVIDESGAPVPDALVSIDRGGLVGGDAALHFPAIEQMNPGPPVVSDGSGEFSMEVLPAPMRVTAEHAASGARGQITHGDPSKPALVRVQRTGSLRGEASGAVAGVCRVAIRGPRAASTVGVGAKCAYAFGQVPAGRYSVDVRVNGASGHANIDVAPGEIASAHIALEALVEVTVRLVDDRGAALTGLIPVLVGADEGTAGDMFLENLAGVHPRSDTQGRALLRAVPGPATLAVFSRDFQRILHVQRMVVAPPRTDVGDLIVAAP